MKLNLKKHFQREKDKMCDQANHDNCEIIDDLHLTISDLEMIIADLKAEIVEDLKVYGSLTKSLRAKWEAK